MNIPANAARLEHVQTIDWHDIEAVPTDRKDGRDMLLWTAGSPVLCSWCDGWRDAVGRPVVGATHYADVEGAGGVNIGIRLAFAASMLLSGGVEAPKQEPRGPEPRWPHNRKQTIATIVMDGARGDVEHVHTEKRLSKRAKRRQRGKAKS